jgi:hypothetical protein
MSRKWFSLPAGIVFVSVVAGPAPEVANNMVVALLNGF